MYQGVNESIKNACLDKLETLGSWYDKESDAPIMPIALENKLEIYLPDDLIFRGTFDKIEQESKDEIRVIDYKTGKPDKHVKAIFNNKDLSSYACDDYYRQLVAYKMLYERSTSGKKAKTTVAKGVLQFLEPVSASVKKYGLEKGTYRNEVVELTDSMVENLEKVIKNVWRDIQSLKFDKLPEQDERDRCARCAFSHVCWEK